MKPLLPAWMCLRFLGQEMDSPLDRTYVFDELSVRALVQELLGYRFHSRLVVHFAACARYVVFRIVDTEPELAARAFCNGDGIGYGRVGAFALSEVIAEPAFPLWPWDYFNQLFLAVGRPIALNREPEVI